jgi:glutathione peroxidase
MAKGQRAGDFRHEKIKWNFTKFLIGRDGRVVKRFAPSAKPEDIASEVEKLL